MSFRTIVVGVDLSPSSFAAARHASALLGPGGRLVLAHIVERTLVTGSPRHEPPEEIERFVQQHEHDARLRLEDLGRELGPKRDVAWKNVVRLGLPVEDLIRIVEEERADLLAVGAHGKSTLEQIVFGSVAEELTRRSPVPTLVARATAEERGADRVLVALDTSTASRAAAGVGAAIAAALSAPVEIVHAIDRVTDDGVRPEQGIEAAPVSIKTFAESAGLPTAPVRILVGVAPKVIAGYARPTDLIVCGTRARRALVRSVLGSVALEVVRAAPCSVVVVRAEHARPGGSA